eukprot:jgi/Astpho2/1849/fgenesh1_pg.00038_%23_20_t
MQAGWTSRDSSPGRSSSFAPVRTSQTGHLQQGSMMMSTLDLKRLWGAGPRTFTKARMRRPGLDTGDVVAFVSEGMTFVVAQAVALEEEPARTNYVFQPTAVSNELALEDRATHLEVGAWVGFRSATAEDRFLQARRKSGQRLAFFNNNFGTWEQWELVAGEPKQPWDRLKLGFRNRRLPQFILTVELVRVGTYAMLPNASLTPRSLIPLEGDVSEREELSKISGLMIYEWFHFVDKERQVRVKIDAKVAQLLEEAAELKTWTISQVESVRADMEGEIVELVAIIRKKNEDMRELEAKLVNRLRWGIMVLQARNENVMRRQVLIWWRKVAEYQQSCAARVSKQLQRSRVGRLATVLQAWAAVAGHRHAVQQRLLHVVLRITLLKVSAAFTQWRERTAESAAARLERATKERVACSRMQHWQLGLFMLSWQAHARSCSVGRQLLGQIARRQQTNLWRRHLVGSRLAREVHSLQHRLLVHWRIVVAERARLGHALHQVLQRRSLGMAGAAFAAWHTVVTAKARHRQLLSKAVLRMTEGRLLGSFTAWRDHAQGKARHQRVAQQHFHFRERGQLAACLVNWQRVAVRRGLRQEQRCLVVQQQRRCQARQLTVAFKAWLSCTDSRHQAQTLHGPVDLRRAQCFRRWHYAVQHTHKREQAVAFCRRRSAWRSMAAAWSQWSGAVSHSRHVQGALAAAVGRLCHRTTATAFQSWRLWVTACQELRDKAETLALATRQGLLRGSFVGWRAVLHVRRWQRVAVMHKVLQTAQGLQAAALSAWRAELQRQRQACQQSNVLLMRALGHRLGASFAGWQAWAAEQHAAKARMQRAVGRLQALQRGAVLLQWRAVTAERRLLRGKAGKALRYFAERSLVVVFTAWHHHMVQRKQQAAAVVKCSRRRSTRQMAACLAAWRGQVEALAEAKAVAVHCLQRCMHNMLAAAFDAWMEHVEAAQKRRQLLLRTIARLSQLRLSQGFEAWRSAVSDVQEAYGRAAKVVARLQHTTLAQAFSAWVDFAKQQYSTEGHVQQMAVTALARMRSLLLARAFEASQAPTWQEAASARQFGRAQAEVKLAVLAGQTRFTADHRQAALLQKTVTGGPTGALAAAFCAWLDCARRQRRVALLRFLARAAHGRKQRAFDCWCAAWQERCEALNRLRACITRKRISFRLFKQWYWESFDEDVQATLHDIFHQTEEDIATSAATGPSPMQQRSPPRLLSDAPARAGSLLTAFPASRRSSRLTAEELGALLESPAALLEGLHPQRHTSSARTSGLYGGTAALMREGSAAYMHSTGHHGSEGAPHAELDGLRRGSSRIPAPPTAARHPSPGQQLPSCPTSCTELQCSDTSLPGNAMEKALLRWSSSTWGAPLAAMS